MSLFIRLQSYYGDSDKAIERGFKNVLLLNPTNALAISFFAKIEKNKLKREEAITYENTGERPRLNDIHPANCRCYKCWEP